MLTSDDDNDGSDDDATKKRLSIVSEGNKRQSIINLYIKLS